VAGETRMSLIKVKSRGTDNVSGRRNLIINGAMQVAQRGTTSTGLNGYYTVDRFRVYNGSVGTLTTSQESSNGPTDVPKYSFKVAATNTASNSASSDAWIRYVIETKDIENLPNLTDSTKNFTVSFYVKCSNTGQSSIGISSGSYNSAQYVHPYTIAAADTWQRVSVTIPGNSLLSNVSGDYGIRMYWDTGAGTNYQTSSTNQWITDGDYAAAGNLQIIGVNGRYLQITGVQFELGDSASDFEHRSFGEELALCQRYYYAYMGTVGGSNGNESHICTAGAYNNITAYGGVQFPQTMRTIPTIVQHTGTDHWQFYNANQSDRFDSFAMFGANQSTQNNAFIYNADTISTTAANAGNFQGGNASCYLHFNAEL